MNQSKIFSPPAAELFTVREFLQSSEHHPAARATTIERCLSVRQPWALAIAAGWKPVENRTWEPGYTGWIAIHASGKPGQIDPKACEFVEDAAAYVPDALNEENWPINPADGKPWNPSQTGSIIGIARIVGSVKFARGEFYAACEAAGNSIAEWWDKRFDAVHIDPDYWAEKGATCWLLDDMRLLAAPIKADGKLNLWRLSVDQQAAILDSKVWPTYPVPPEDRID